MKLLAFFLVLLPSLSLDTIPASTVITGDKILITEVVEHDLYLAAGVVIIQAPIHGDLIVAGGTVVVQDTVSEDILVAGGDVTVVGFVGDDIRCAAGALTLSGDIAGDVVATGGRVLLSKTGSIAGNLVCSGGDFSVDGMIRGDMESASGTLTMNGTVGRNATWRGGRIIANGAVLGSAVMAAETIEVGANAKFGHPVRYWNRTGTLEQGTAAGIQATYDASLEVGGAHWRYLGFASLVVALWYLATALVMMVLIQYLFSRTLLRAAATVRTLSLKSLGVGFLFLIGVPVTIVFLFVTVIGIPLGILALMAYGTLIVLATIIVSLLIANWINATFYQSMWTRSRIVATAFLVFVIVKLFSLTPFVGPPIMLLLAAMAFGALLLNVRWGRRHAPDYT